MTAWFSAGSFAIEGNRDEECTPDCTAIVGGDHEPACRAAGARVRVVNRDSIFLGETGTVAHVYASGTRIVELDGYGTAVPFGYTELEGVEAMTYVETTTAPETTIMRARCAGHEGYRNGRKHLVSLDRLLFPIIDTTRRQPVVYAKGPCPVCGVGGHLVYGEYGPADRSNSYLLVGVKGTFVADTKCRASCLQSASAECKCSCGGADHGMYA